MEALKISYDALLVSAFKTDPPEFPVAGEKDATRPKADDAALQGAFRALYIAEGAYNKAKNEVNLKTLTEKRQGLYAALQKQMQDNSDAAKFDLTNLKGEWSASHTTMRD